MALKDLSTRLRAGATIAIATATLTTCNKDGAVDPAPPPADCNIPSTTELNAYGYKEQDGTLTVVVQAAYEATYTGTSVTELMGCDLVSVTSDNLRSIQIGLRRNPSTTSIGWFLVKTTVIDGKNATCSAEKKFNFAITTSGVTISSRHVAALPLDVRFPAAITLVAQQGNTLELAGRTAYRGPQHSEWSVSGGIIESQTGDRLRWQLPDEPGLYQVELVIDYGEGGFAIDHMTFEVSRAIAEGRP